MHTASVKKRKRLIKTLSIIAVIAITVTVFCSIYVNDYYRTDKIAVEAFEAGGHVEMYSPKEGVTVIEAEGSSTGFIFYPGGKVEYTSYIPLMKACATRGITCIITEMPFNLAVLNVDAAKEIRASHPDIETWYIGGHSLGGSMAASHVAGNITDYEGLILLGSYSTADLSDESVKVLSIYGSEDEVLNREKYTKYKPNLPQNTVEFIIEGGCHAGFGMYGAQDGDGIPTITSEEQILITADIIENFIFNDTNT